MSNSLTKTAGASMTRRKFLGHAAGGVAAACCAPLVVPSSALGAFAPSERINVGFIGLGNQSRIDLPAFLGHDDVQVVAVCDVNRGSNHYLKPEHFLGREPGRRTVNEHYAGKTGVADYKGCDAYNDFREVLGRADVDAVTVVVPDHWHALITVMAAKAGKDIYCEKPMSLTVWQGQRMVKAVRENKRVFQTGSMYRSYPWLRRGCEMVRNGRIGKLTKIVTDVNRNNFPSPGPGWKAMPCTGSASFSTTRAGRSPTRGTTRTTRGSGGAASTAPGRWSSRIAGRNGPSQAACTPRPRRRISAPATPTELNWNAARPTASIFWFASSVRKGW